MKFWQKSFFCIIIVFLIGFDVMGYMLAKHSYDLNENYAMQYAQKEQKVIQDSLFSSISISQKNFIELNPMNLNVTVAPYAEFYKNQGIYFQLYQDGELMYNNLPVSLDREILSATPDDIQIKEIDQNLYCFIVSSLNSPSSKLQYIYAKDMQSLSHYKSQIIKTFTTISTIVSCVLAVIMLFLLIGLTGPFRKLNAVATEISKGHYDKRVAVKSHDEIGDFAKSFNLMADHIEEHIDVLSRMTDSKQTFIDNFAHEIRTPTTAIIGYGELLKYANCNESEKELAVNHIIGQGKRIQNMSLKLMDLAYMSNENIETIPIQLEDILTEVKTSIAYTLQKKDISICITSKPSTINGDPDLIKSLLINLLVNAINASPNGSTIDIRLDNFEKGILIEITDYGKGMESSEIAKITEPFYRIDKSRSRNDGGAGLGLSLCMRICEIHNAKLDISSEIGKGTTIKLLFTTL